VSFVRSIVIVVPRINFLSVSWRMVKVWPIADYKMNRLSLRWFETRVLLLAMRNPVKKTRSKSQIRDRLFLASISCMKSGVWKHAILSILLIRSDLIIQILQYVMVKQQFFLSERILVKRTFWFARDFSWMKMKSQNINRTENSKRIQ
jgi:hypothetical protein